VDRDLVGNPEGKTPLRRTRCSLVDNLWWHWRIILRWIFRKWNVGVGAAAIEIASQAHMMINMLRFQ
jgi:hypothetical protein